MRRNSRGCVAECVNEEVPSRDKVTSKCIFPQHLLTDFSLRFRELHEPVDLNRMRLNELKFVNLVIKLVDMLRFSK